MIHAFAEVCVPFLLIFSRCCALEEVIDTAKNRPFWHGNKFIPCNCLTPLDEGILVGQIEHFEAKKHVQLSAFFCQQERYSSDCLPNIKDELHDIFAFCSILAPACCYVNRYICLIISKKKKKR